MNKNVLIPIVRKAVLTGQSDMIRDLLLNDSQLFLLEHIRNKREITASQLAFEDNISLPNASQKLKRLYQSGYISRSTRSAETGGIEYVYRSNQ